MSVAGAEALAGLQLLVAVAQADSALTDDERAVIAEALEDADLPAGISREALMDSTYDVDALIAQIQSQDARDVAFGACLTMANANAVRLPGQQTILDKIDRAWAVPDESKALVGRVLDEARGTTWLWLKPLEPAADGARRAALIRDEVLRCSVLAAALGLDPRPLVSVATDLAVVGLQTALFRDIGALWGVQASPEAARRVVAGIGVGAGARVAVIGIIKFVPDVGSVFAATTNFASTWALGRVADDYWAGGGDPDLDTADVETLRATFETAKAQGRRLYAVHAADVEAKRRAHVASIAQLAAECEAGRITLSDYVRGAAELK